MYLQRIVHGVIRNPGSRQMDILRSYYEQQAR